MNGGAKLAIDGPRSEPSVNQFVKDLCIDGVAVNRAPKQRWQCLCQSNARDDRDRSNPGGEDHSMVAGPFFARARSDRMPFFFERHYCRSAKTTPLVE